MAWIRQEVLTGVKRVHKSDMQRTTAKLSSKSAFQLGTFVQVIVFRINLRNSAQARKRAGDIHLGFVPRADITRSPKHEYQWPTKRTCGLQKLKKIVFRIKMDLVRLYNILDATASPFALLFEKGHQLSSVKLTGGSI